LLDDVGRDTADLSEGLAPLTRSRAKEMAIDLMDAGMGACMDADLL
jgi:hypothetical protein